MHAIKAVNQSALGNAIGYVRSLAAVQTAEQDRIELRLPFSKLAFSEDNKDCKEHGADTLESQLSSMVSWRFESERALHTLRRAILVTSYG